MIRPGHQIASRPIDADHHHQDSIARQHLPVAHHHLADIADGRAIHIDIANRRLADDLAKVVAEFHKRAVLGHDHLLGAEQPTHAQRHFAVQHHVAVIAMERHHELGPEHRQHHLQLLLRRVAGDMHALPAIDDIGAQPEQVVDHTPDRDLVAGDRRGRDDDRIAGLDLDVRIIAIGHTRQGGHRLALAACANDRNLVVGIAGHLVRADERARLDAQVAQVERNA